MRWAFAGVGLSAIAGSTMMAVVKAGGLSAPSAPGLIVMGLVLAVGTAAIGYALRNGHGGLAVMIGLGMISGEVGAIVQTAQRVTAAREAQRAPLVAEELRRKDAEKELSAALAVILPPVDRSRIDAAERAKAAAEQAVREKSAEKGCRENCRLLLQAAVDAAAREVDAARNNLAKSENDQRAALAERIEHARAALAALPPPQSATPLADASGVAEWLLDVIEAVCLSLAINVPASALVALGVKGEKTPEPSEERDAPAGEIIAVDEAVSVRVADIRPSTASPPDAELKALPPPTRRRSAKVEADQFGGAMLRRDDGATASPNEIEAAYYSWCEARGLNPLPRAKIAAALWEMFGRVGLAIEADGAVRGVAVVGVEAA